MTDPKRRPGTANRAALPFFGATTIEELEQGRGPRATSVPGC
ncbi:MAG TPA: hypothetical protein VG758_16345 [Hyphomicrobiaceae bacterium]|jgi:hypothetical protein|nr:hypothetical protein [Hyphomicrobiaceae bacterium]